MSKINFLKPDKSNLNTFLYLGSFLFFISILDVLLNSFFSLNITGFLPSFLSFLLPLILGFVGLYFIRIELSGIKQLDLLNKNINTNNFNAILSLLIIFIILKSIPPILSWFSLILISYGAWPITIFLGAEYFLLVYLVRMYFKNKNIAENITIDADVIKIEKLKQDKISKTSIFKTYWSKINFYKHKNTSFLTIRQSSQEEEIGTFLHSDLKEKLYYKIKNYLALK